jgi:hypothetical protein
MQSVLPGSWKVPDLFRSRLGEQAGRQRAMAAEGHLLLVLHDVPVPGEPERSAVLFWRDPAGVWRSTGTGSGIGELQDYLQRFKAEVDKLEAQIDGEPNARNFFEALHASTPLLRLIRNMHRALQDAREAAPSDRALLLARDTAGELERAADLLHSDARNGLDFLIASQAEEQAERAEQLVQSGYKLNLLVAIFLPLTALGSAFGMNFKHGLEHVQSPWLFWLVLGAGIFLGFLVKGAVSIKSNTPPPAEKKWGGGARRP